MEEMNLEMEEKPSIQPETPEPGLPVRFSVGELLPWKGRWFRLVDCRGGVIALEMVKPTGASVKRMARMDRWAKQHPKAMHGYVNSRPGHLA